MEHGPVVMTDDYDILYEGFSNNVDFFDNYSTSTFSGLVQRRAQRRFRCGRTLWSAQYRFVHLFFFLGKANDTEPAPAPSAALSMLVADETRYAQTDVIVDAITRKY